MRDFIKSVGELIRIELAFLLFGWAMRLMPPTTEGRTFVKWMGVAMERAAGELGAMTVRAVARNDERGGAA